MPGGIFLSLPSFLIFPKKFCAFSQDEFSKITETPTEIDDKKILNDSILLFFRLFSPL